MEINDDACKGMTMCTSNNWMDLWSTGICITIILNQKNKYITNNSISKDFKIIHTHLHKTVNGENHDEFDLVNGHVMYFTLILYLLSLISMKYLLKMRPCTYKKLYKMSAEKTVSSIQINIGQYLFSYSFI